MSDPASAPVSAPVVDDGPTLSSLAGSADLNASLLSQLQPTPLTHTGGAAIDTVFDVTREYHPDTNQNIHTIRCRFCECKVLTPNSSVYLNKEDDSRVESLRDFWFVASQMDFENVGVTRSVDPAYRYLTCANCDRGPIGINYLNEPTKFYVAHARVRYDS